mgnify:CR=1 FL=1
MMTLLEKTPSHWLAVHQDGATFDLRPPGLSVVRVEMR